MQVAFVNLNYYFDINNSVEASTSRHLWTTRLGPGFHCGATITATRNRLKCRMTRTKTYWFPDGRCSRA
jgi:hypothetical protein